MENSNLTVKEDSNLNVNEEEERSPPSVACPATEDTETSQTNQETESTQTNEEIGPTQMNMSDENEHGAQLSTIEPANLQQGKKPIEAERDRVLQALLRFVEEKSDEIFTVKNTEKKTLSDSTPMLSELKSEPTSGKRGMTIIKIEEPTSSKIAPSNNEVALTFRKRKRKQERPSRAPMGDGLDEILVWAKQTPLRASSPVEDKKKTKKKKAKK